MQKSLNMDPGKCTGCLQCEMACSFEHTETFNPSRLVYQGIYLSLRREICALHLYPVR